MAAEVWRWIQPILSGLVLVGVVGMYNSSFDTRAAIVKMQTDVSYLANSMSKFDNKMETVVTKEMLNDRMREQSKEFETLQQRVLVLESNNHGGKK